MLYGLIMAGGIGTRLWPQSRVHNPKQLLKLAGDESMFQHSVYRLDPLFPADKVFVVAREDLIASLNEHVPEIPAGNFIVEPEGRGTAPAIGLGAIYLSKRDPNAVMAVMTADHWIRKIGDFQNVLGAAAELANAGHLVTMGIKPSHPSTGFGYIQQGENLGKFKGVDAYKVVRFTEKPDSETAKAMLAGGDHAWNSGMFIWRVDRILQEFEKQMPAFYTKLMEIADVLDTPDYETVLDEIWPTVEKETIDYGIMERAENVAVLPVEIGWTDVGSWSAVSELRKADADGNIVEGQHIGVDTRNTMILGGKRMITTIGLEDVIVIDTDDAILICAKGHEQDVKAIVNALKDSGKTDLL